jgi:hypothetical protein
MKKGVCVSFGSRGEENEVYRFKWRKNLQEKDIDAYLKQTCDALDPFLSITPLIAVEKQMHKKGEKRLILLIGEKLLSYLKGRYPNAHVFCVAMGSVRTFMDTKGKCKEERKQKSMALGFGMLGPEQFAVYRSAFGKDRDPMESMQIGHYTLRHADHLQKLANTKLPPATHTKTKIRLRGEALDLMDKLSNVKRVKRSS